MPPPPRPRPLTPPQSPDTTETPASPPDPPTFRSPASDRSPAPPDGAAPAEEEEREPIIGEPRTVRRDHEQPMTNKTFQDILIEQLEAAAELGNSDAMYQLFLNEKMCPEDPSKADEDRAEEYLKYAYENNLEPWTAMQIMRYSRWGYDGEINAKARESGDLRPGAKPPDWHEWSGIPDPSNPSRPQTKGSMGSMNSFRTDPSEEPPRLIEDEDSQTTWLEDDGSGRFPSVETIGS